MPELEHGEYRRLLNIVAGYAMVLNREPERAAGFFTAGDMSAVEIDALIEKNAQQEHIVVALDE